MSKLFVMALAACLLLMPLAVNLRSVQATTEAPPIAQPLVREGDFAVKLVAALKLSTTENESRAESLLASMGIAPRNGWISDYPVTPDIYFEVQEAVAEAADSGKLAMGKTQALVLVRNVGSDFGLPVFSSSDGGYSSQIPGVGEVGSYSGPVASESSSGYSDSQSPVVGDSPSYYSPAAIEDYYYDEGPPVVTYYPPPWDYSYLYTWVPSPFWWSGFGFSGFFILHDFDRVVVRKNVSITNVNNVTKITNVNHTFPKRVTNHITVGDPQNVVTVDPLTRNRGPSHGNMVEAIHPARFETPEVRKAAESIVNRDLARRGASGFSGRSPASFSGGPGGTGHRTEGVSGDRGGASGGGGGSGGSGGSRVNRERSFSSPGIGIFRGGGGGSSGSGGSRVNRERSFSSPGIGTFRGGGGGGSQMNRGSSFSSPGVIRGGGGGGGSGGSQVNRGGSFSSPGAIRGGGGSPPSFSAGSAGRGGFSGGAMRQGGGGGGSHGGGFGRSGSSGGGCKGRC